MDWLGLTVPSWEGGFQKRMSSRQKGKSVRRLREDLESGVWSLFKRRKKSVLSVSGERQQVQREFTDSASKGPVRAG